MASVSRAGILAIALTVGLSLSIAATPAMAKKSPGQKCEKIVKKSVKKFDTTRLKKLQKCANNGIKKGSSVDGCFVTTKLKPIKEKKCSSEALDELGYKQNCASLNPACNLGPITDATSLTSCLECHLNNATGCMIAVTYNATTQMGMCFLEPTTE